MRQEELQRKKKEEEAEKQREEEKKSGLLKEDRELLKELEAWNPERVKEKLEERLVSHLKNEETRDFCLNALQKHFESLVK